MIEAWILLCLVYFDHTNAVVIEVPPHNVTSLVGTEARFTCYVKDRRPTDYVFWKKQSSTGSGFSDILSYNTHVLDSSKYMVEGDFTLRVRSVTLDDEGWYECQAGVDRAKAFLNVNVLPVNVTMTHTGYDVTAPSGLINLTCISVHSRPPADIRWFRGQTDISVISSSTTSKTHGSNGYGDTVSVLTVTSNDVTSYRCVASLPGTSNTVEQIWFPPWTGVASIPTANWIPLATLIGPLIVKRSEY